MIEYRQGNVLKCEEDIILHQVNVLGRMGAGLALQIKNKYPEIMSSYELLCSRHYNCKEKLMGTVDIHPTHDGKYVASIFGQMNVGRGIRQTDYDALRTGLEKVESYAKVFDKSVAIPMRLGSGLGGGSWSVVEKMIKDVFSSSQVKLVIYEYKG